MLDKIQKKLASFRTDNRGSMSIEAVIIVPLLFWCGAATFTFFDAYKAQNATFRANYAVSDLLSRATLEIDDAYLNGLVGVFEEIARTNTASSWMRVSVVGCTANCADIDRVLEWNWSKGLSGSLNLRDTDMINYEPIIPLLAEGDRLILVETSMEYKPVFGSIVPGFNNIELESNVVTRPRFVSQLCFNDSCDNDFTYDPDNNDEALPDEGVGEEDDATLGG